MRFKGIKILGVILVLTRVDCVLAEPALGWVPMEGMRQDGEEAMRDWMPLFSSTFPSPHALHSAILRGDQQAVSALLRGGAIVDNRDNWQGETPLHLAIRTRQPTMVRLLLDSAAERKSMPPASAGQPHCTPPLRNVI